MNKIKQGFYWFFYGIFVLVFGYLFLRIFIRDTIHNYTFPQLLPGFLIGGGMLTLSYYLCRRGSSYLKKHFLPIVLCVLALFFVGSIYTGYKLRFTPAFDMDAIYGGALQWLNEGSFPSYYEYMGYFPNNLGGMTFLYIVFKISSICGCQDFFAVGMVWNSFLITMTILLGTLICKKLKGTIAGIMALITFCLFLPFYVLGAAFYTDSLSMVFPVLFYYLYLLYKEQTVLKKQIGFGVLMAVILTIGMLVKFTVVIVLIAVLIDSLLNNNLKKTAILSVLCVSIAFVGFKSLDASIYGKHMDKAAADELETPYLHWMMMGLQGTGGYNPEDYEYTRSFPADTRKEACKTRIEERLQALGFGGLFELCTNKATLCFGDGTIAVSDFLDDTPAQSTRLQTYVLYSGENFAFYQHISTGYLLAIYFIMVAGVIYTIFVKNKEDAKKALAPRLCCLGILAFLLMWETNSRYITNFVPMLLISATLAITWIGGKKEDV